MILNWFKTTEEKEAVSSVETLVDIPENPLRDVTLPFYFIGLAGQLARSDGEINDEEIIALLGIRFLETHSAQEKRDLFLAAGSSPARDSYFARKIVTAFPENTPLYRQIFLNLLHIGLADGALNIQENQFFHVLSSIFHLTNEEIEEDIGHYMQDGAKVDLCL